MHWYFHKAEILATYSNETEAEIILQLFVNKNTSYGAVKLTPTIPYSQYSVVCSDKKLATNLIFA